MRTLIAAALLLVGCGGVLETQEKPKTTTQAINCADNKVPVYQNRFAPQAGGSGVASYSDAEAGKISSDSGGGETKGGVDGTEPASPPSTATGPQTAMQLTCGVATCDVGQVAVELAPKVANGGGISSGGDFGGPVGAPAGDPAPTPPPAPASAPAPAVVCAPPPPTCPAGESPQFIENGSTWECTDCSLVVTYGGIYGNYRRCVNMPTVTCTGGEVPTYVLETEKWECKPKCDNGLYDQHTIKSVLVCVPC